MKTLSGFLFVLLTAAVWAQAPAAPPGPPPPGHAMHHPMNPDAMAAMHQKHMDEAKADLEKMKATLAEMKARLAKIKQPGSLKEIDQMNTELWETMVGHMERMLKSMEEAHPGPMGMMRMHHEMGEHHAMEGEMHHEGMAGCCCGEMKDGHGCGGSQCGKPKPPIMEEKAPPATK